MTFFSQRNTLVERVFFIIFASVCAVLFVPAVVYRFQFKDIWATNFVPILCVLLVYENIIQAFGEHVGYHHPSVEVAKAVHAVVVPLFLLVMFELAYAVHKRRSVKFCGIVFDQGHRVNTDHFSWFLRNFVRIVTLGLVALGVLVDFNVIGEDANAENLGYVDLDKDHNLEVVLALVPTTAVAVIGLYISLYMWKYGNNASIVLYSTWCNRWIVLFIGTLCLLLGQVAPSCCFRVTKEAGQVILLCLLILMYDEIGREIRATNQFSRFLEEEIEKDNLQVELPARGGVPAMASAAQHPRPATVHKTPDLPVEPLRSPDPARGVKPKHAAFSSSTTGETTEPAVHVV